MKILILCLRKILRNY